MDYKKEYKVGDYILESKSIQYLILDVNMILSNVYVKEYIKREDQYTGRVYWKLADHGYLDSNPKWIDIEKISKYKLLSEKKTEDKKFFTKLNLILIILLILICFNTLNYNTKNKILKGSNKMDVQISSNSTDKLTKRRIKRILVKKEEENKLRLKNKYTPFVEFLSLEEKEYINYIILKYKNINTRITTSNKQCSHCHSDNVVTKILRVTGKLDGHISQNTSITIRDPGNSISLVLLPVFFTFKKDNTQVVNTNIEGNIHGEIDTLGVKHCNQCGNEEYYTPNISYISKEEINFKDNLLMYIDTYLTNSKDYKCYNTEWFKLCYNKYLLRNPTDINIKEAFKYKECGF